MPASAQGPQLMLTAGSFCALRRWARASKKAFAARASRTTDAWPFPGQAGQELVSGVVLIPGAWNTTLVRQSDGIVVIEAPISSGYSVQAIAEANKRFPGIPIKAVITTSDAWPHIGGVREYVAILMREQEIRWHRLESGTYKLHRPTPKGVYRSRAFPGLWLDGHALWKYDLAGLLQTLERGLRSAEHGEFVKQLAARKN